ncbi:MAG: adenylate/guanylate cyclase domain-containing protein [Proteobacteria bacterium]|nr:adenylate/guanylate cyclase domain-containing protein [Pseudomonadota bacterium]MBS0465291.1 adenylate/guanylate cyclase domain-containing protein [Pseudomonadota bacterium]
MASTQPATILFADVSGSTRLFEQRGDVEARRLIANVLNALTVVCNSHGGRVIKTIGDEIMCTFRSVLQGVLAACDMQRKMARDIDFVRDNLAVRIGLHHGDALFEDDDVFGDAVNVAARMTSLAKREQIVTTAASLRELTGPPISVRSLGRARVAGKLLPIEIVDVIWQEDTSGMTTVQRAVRTMAAEPNEPTRLVLRYKDQVIELTPESDPLTLGRESTNKVTVAADWVSRNHATIEYKRGHFVLSDRSTNGTWVKLGTDDELRLSRDEVHLRKSGTISLGKGAALNGEQLVHFDCDAG